jgi:DNA-binding winged helix-turn-helix (wHTH) protein
MAHGDRSVDVFVRKLRQKIERSSPGWRYIHTHFGIGYRFDPSPAEGDAALAGDEADANDLSGHESREIPARL